MGGGPNETNVSDAGSCPSSLFFSFLSSEQIENVWKEGRDDGTYVGKEGIVRVRFSPVRGAGVCGGVGEGG